MTINEIIAEALQEWGDERIEHGRAILNNYGITPQQNTLPQAFYINSVATGGVSKLLVYAPDYYTFVDEGVMGIDGTTDATGRFRFRTPYWSKKMVESIRLWAISKGLPSVPKTEQEGAKKRPLKYRGIRKTMFWSNTFDDNGYQRLSDLIQEKLSKNFDDDFNISIA
jgi:hypothetical protein